MSVLTINCLYGWGVKGVVLDGCHTLVLYQCVSAAPCTIKGQFDMDDDKHCGIITGDNP